MIQYKSIFIFLIFALVTTKVLAQANPTISVIGLGTTNPNNAGEVPVGSTLDLQVVVGNTGTANIVAFKVRPVVTVPAIVTFLPDAEQTGLPAGWSIVSNTGAQLRICNGLDVIAGSDSRTIILKVRGVTVGGPSTFLGQLNFGGASCAALGPAPSGNVTADDNATSTVTVVSGTLPLTLLDFKASLINCLPSLKWETENEINSDRFEIERSEASNGVWRGLGAVTANAISPSTKTNYNFADVSLNATSARVFYRLKIIDKDGSHKYSNVLPVFVNCKTVQVNVYPNPVQDGKLYVSLTGTTGITEALLMSITGQVISKNKLTNGTNYVDVTNVVNGSYVLSVRDENGVDKKVKVLIQK